MNRTTRRLGLVVAALGVGCLGGAGSGDNALQPTQPSANDGTFLGTSGGPDNTFNHQLDNVDPFAVLKRIQEEGPPEISTRMHSCQKLKYEVLGNILADFGVDLSTPGAAPPTAGDLYATGAQAMGAANYGARVPESIELTAAGATKLFDIFTRAAPEIITAMPNVARCKVAGLPTSMFDASGHCTLDGIACLKGSPASPDQVALCNQAVSEGSTPAIGQTVAVATVLSAAHTCE